MSIRLLWMAIMSKVQAVIEWLELDYMETLVDDAAAQAAYVSSDSDPASWDLLDEDCTDISDWSDDDTGEAVSQVNPAGKFELDTNTSADTNDRAYRSRDIGSLPDDFTLEIKLYHDALGTIEDDDIFIFQTYQADGGVIVYFTSDGIFRYDSDLGGNGLEEIGTDLVKCNASAEWQTWRLLFDKTATGVWSVDVYLTDSTHTNELVGDGVQFKFVAAGTDGLTRFQLRGYTTDDRITHIDWIKIATGLWTPAPYTNMIFISD